MEEPRLKTDILSDDEDVLKNCIKKEFAHSVANISRYISDSSLESDQASPYPYLETTPPVPLSSTINRASVQKTKYVEYPEKKYNVSVFICVILWAGLMSGILGAALKMDFLNVQLGILTNPAETESFKLRHTQNTQYKSAKGSSDSKPSHVNSNSFQNRKEGLHHVNNHRYSMSSETINIPIFLDLPGTGTVQFTETLSNCLGLKGISANMYDNNVRKKVSPKGDFIVLRSLCGLHKSYFKSQKQRVFVLMQNPVQRVIQDYNDMKNTKSPYYDKEVVTLTLSEYLKSAAPEKSNVLTRSILCKPKNELNDKNFDFAKSFLKEKAYVGDFQDYSTSIKMFQHRFKWWKKSVSSVSNCVESNLKTYADKERLLYKEQESILHEIKRKNFYDFGIYMDYAKEKDKVDVGDNNVKNLGSNF